MKPEMVITLRAEAEKAKFIISQINMTRYQKFGYFGALMSTFFGINALAIAIRMTVDNHVNTILSITFLFASLCAVIAPWYLIIRYEMNRKIQLLCEAILSVNEKTPE
jgi:hypothetical protein